MDESRDQRERQDAHAVQTASADGVREKVRRFVETHALLDRTLPVLVGFSGGADSTALVILLRDLGAQMTAVHLHHGLRAREADRDAEWCDAFCRERSIPFECHRLEVPAAAHRGEGVEEAARRCRLTFWQTRAGNRLPVALGHHADDCLEDMLLRLSRGANASGLTGLRPSRRLHGVRVVRPLLCLRRREIETFLGTLGVERWCEDSTNADVGIRRNAVRHRWLPLIRETVGRDAGLLRTLEAVCQDADCLEQQARAAARGNTLDLAALRSLHPALLPRVLRLWLAEQSGRDIIPSHSTVARIGRELERHDSHPRQVPIGHGTTLVLEPHGIRLRHESMPLRDRTWRWRDLERLELPETGASLSRTLVSAEDIPPDDWADPRTEFFAPDSLPDELTVRAWRPGDTLVPFARRTGKKLQDLFVDEHIPAEQRHSIPVLLAGEDVVWVAGLRRAEFARVSAVGGQEVVRLRYAETTCGEPDTEHEL